MANIALVSFLVTLLVVPAVYAADHVVGGSSGWNQGVNFASWAAGETFVVGDNLVFNYGSSHSVDEINQADYTSCTTGNALNSYNGGQSTVALKKAGPMYFLCPSFGHCGGGMKLSINVVAATTPTTPASPTPPKTGTPPSTPESPSTPAKDSPPKDSGATGGIGDMNKLVVGMCVVFAGVMFGFMG